ncbi:FecR family protein [Geomonas paludis]|uniref:FecR family protein n=1 Tax=Geomonas paludis TaxID=2740185 RepID=A0A6V8MSQ0_9BACT|nr:FecR family protein [Geomonas paludis]UPU35777.1 FecR family protein [Geomonas paludis]GFO62643.1 hypothetical protein GMPD_05620 [Geomonas paludis]
MKVKTVAILLSILLLTVAGAAWADVVGKLTRVEGAVDVMPGGQLPAVAAKEGSPLQKGDFVRTKSNSRAEITFNDGSVVKVAQRSRLDVSEYSGAARKLTLPRGKVQATVVPASGGKAPHTFEIRTPNAIAGVRGTSFFVYHQANVTGVAVLEGVVQTSSVNAPSKGVTLVAGTATSVAKSRPPTPPRPVTQTELNSHQSDVTPTTQSSAAPGAAATGETAGATGTTGTTGTATTGTSATTDSSTGTSATGSTDSTGTATSTGGTDSTGTTSTGTTSTTGSLSTDTLLTGGALQPTAPTGPVQTSPGPQPTTVIIPVNEATGSGTLTKTYFSSVLGANLMSRLSTIDPKSNLLTIVGDGAYAPTLSGTTSLWAGSATSATLKGSYPTLPLQQPNHYFLGNFNSASPGTNNDTTADGGAYAGYFGGMSLDAPRSTESRLSALYVDPTGKAGIMQGTFGGAISADATGYSTSSSGTLKLNQLNSGIGLNPAGFSAGWWDPTTTGSPVIEVGPGKAIFDDGATSGDGAKFGVNPSEGFLFDASLNETGEMIDRGDVIKLGYFSSDPSFGIWSRESFGSYTGTGAKFVLVTNAEWGGSADGTIPMTDAVKIISLGDWQEGALHAGAYGIWGNLASGDVKLLAGSLVGSTNSGASSTSSSSTGDSTFGAVTTGAFIDIKRFLADPTTADALGFPIQSVATVSLHGSNSTGTVSFDPVRFYSRAATDPVQLWVAPALTGTFSGTLGQQRFSLLNGTTSSGNTILGELYINSTSSTGTWLGTMHAIGESVGSGFRSDFDGIAAGHFTGTTFNGVAAGMAHPVTFFNTIDGSTAQLTRFSSGSVVSYGALDGVMGGMSLWGGSMSDAADFKVVGVFTPSQTLTAGDYVFNAPIFSKDLPSGVAITADGGAYSGNMVAAVRTGAGGSAPGIVGIMNALYVDPAGNAGVLRGKFGGFLDQMTSLWMGDGEVLPVQLSGPGGITAANLNSGGISTVTTNFGATGTSFSGVPNVAGWLPGSYTRSFISASPDWGIGQFALYAPYSAPPVTGSRWSLGFALTDSAAPSYILSGEMAGSPWEPASGMLFAGVRGGWLDTKPANLTATPTTGIFIGETVGTFNPASLQAMTSGVWMETAKYLALVSTATGRATLDKLNIPAVEVGKADFSGGNANFNVAVNDLRFFARDATSRPQLFATDNISGTYSALPVGSVTLNQVASGTGYAVSGITPTFSIKQWDTTGNKWSGALNFNGNSGVVNGMTNVQFNGVAGGRINTNGAGTFTGTAAGMAR